MSKYAPFSPQTHSAANPAKSASEPNGMTTREPPPGLLVDMIDKQRHQLGDAHRRQVTFEPGDAIEIEIGVAGRLFGGFRGRRFGHAGSAGRERAQERGRVERL